jgi:acyl carrier protein
VSIEDINNRIIEVMIRELELTLTPDQIRNAGRLDDLFGMDSIAITELIIGIEKEFALRIPAEDLSDRLFVNLETLAEYLQMRLRNKTVTNGAGQDEASC